MNQEKFDQALAGTGMPDVGIIMAYEGGELDEDQIVQMTQHGIDHGWIWHLQGSYGRLASRLIADGLCSRKAS